MLVLLTVSVNLHQILPPVWSAEGPVINVGVEPLCQVQSKASVIIWFQLQRLLSKLQSRLQTKGKHLEKKIT